MAPPKKNKKDQPGRKTIADNRRARFEYKLDDVIEAGVILTGTEVKATARRQGEYRRELL